ncbi:RNA polymerase II transcription factor B subunit 2 [Saitoella complicata NRRL Y-17804]|uniref:RNA polymerase II transcription factor B subunit 2 n=1 Tax=Saitoella complicata (strain BCRC 22490 / CBS 7301 / JCM 7358 / NBRC 10748 / NRRL Y-17804) TaxID=698492 RepID=A0A0E9NCR6_SAICN|nr:RNA polymerase II transcription factor B subunit 2 [Saitoella complicata NRRL Y-17804]ODQ52546.1 RNA polymerase II transcription factor B subunit 2 [Saitoella complicata NRRL Y-17804]GAO47491.1 hypothetical protein G7K_1697-t1 [Saitoella complicata NRRL Y-17804]
MASTSTDFKTSINDYLEGLPAPVFSRLYQKPATCLAIFRLLPSLAKQFVMSTLYNDAPVEAASFDAWVEPGSKGRQNSAMDKLKRMQIYKEYKGEVTMNPAFRTNFRIALTGGGDHKSFGVPCSTADKNAVTVGFLDSHATEQWEMILHFMVNTLMDRMPGDGVVRLLQKSGLMEGNPQRRETMSITNAGFQFLLQDVNAQIWALLLQYLTVAEELEMDPVEVLHFLFMLGSLELGQDYSTDFLTPTQRIMLEDLRDYGVVYQRKSTSRRFYPTRLATTLTAHAGQWKRPAAGLQGALSAKLDPGSQSGFIVLETNYKVYAYTNSPLQIAVLRLFASLKARFPNMVTGIITRESVLEALKNGINADQIIQYLTTHAHSQMRRQQPLIPPTVVDQIRLWELDKNRIRANEGWLWHDFASTNDYEFVLKYAKDLGVVLWENATKRSFYVSDAGNASIKAFISRNRKKD